MEAPVTWAAAAGDTAAGTAKVPAVDTVLSAAIDADVTKHGAVAMARVTVTATDTMATSRRASYRPTSVLPIRRAGVSR